MPTLSAQFKLNITSPCLLALPTGHIPQVSLEQGAFKITAKLIPTFEISKGKDDNFWTTALDRIEITVSRIETHAPPSAIIKPDGTKDLTSLCDYFNMLLPDYKSVALTISNLILHYFRYSLFTPLVRHIPAWDNSLNNPTWLDDSGEKIQDGNYMMVVEPIPGLMGELASKKLTLDKIHDLDSFLKNPSEPTLTEMLLSDAQTAWFEHSLRRSVLELAICAEVMVKRCFFNQSSPAGAAFDYLEDKAKISVRVLELLDSVAEEAFSRSYKKEHPSYYQNIDHLFRCRNKIAHRGELTFRGDSGKLINTNAPLVETWWNTVANLKEWLEQL